MITSARTGWLSDESTTARGRFAAVLVIVLATLFGAGVRLHDLGGGGVWFDELYTLRDLTPDHTGMGPTRWLGYQPTKIMMTLLGTGSEEIPGFRYWEYRSAGVDMAEARLASCLIGIFSIPLLAWAAWRPLGPGVAAALAVLIAVCVWNVGWSQSARFYTQVGLFGGLAVLWYLDGITTGSKWRFAASTLMVVLCYMSHPPAILIGGALVLDALVQLIRRKPLNYGVWGWSWAAISIAIVIGITVFEMFVERRYEFRSTGTGEGGEGGGASVALMAQSAPMILVFFAIMMTPVLMFTALIGFTAGRRQRVVWVLAFAAVIPVIAITGIAANDGYAHARYAYVAMVGWLALGAVGMWYVALALRPRLGPVLAWSPMALVVVALLPTLGSYLTTGHRFIEPFHVGLHAIAADVEPGDAVFAERYEVAQYYLQREDILELPGAVEVMDERAAGREAWIIRLSANSRGRRHWKPADHPRMELVFRDAGAVWLPRREVSVYRLSPPSGEERAGADQAELEGAAR